MRSPTRRVSAVRCGRAARALAPHWAIPLGIDAVPADSLATSLRAIAPQRLPPLLALSYVCACWATWRAAGRSAKCRDLFAAAEATVSPEGFHRIVQRTLCVSRGKRLPLSALAALLRYAAAAEDTDGETIAALVARLADQCAADRSESARSWSAACYSGIHHHSANGNTINNYSNTASAASSPSSNDDDDDDIDDYIHDNARYIDRNRGTGVEIRTGDITQGGARAYEVALRATFATSLPVNIAPLVRAVLSRRPLRTQTVHLCLHHVAAVVRGRHTGALCAETVLGAFHACALLALRWLLHEGLHCGPMHGDLCIQVMSCLKHAPLFVLCDAYEALSSRGLMTPSVQCKFLANCGLAAGARLPSHCAAMIVEAFGSLAKSAQCGDARAVEEGLVHGSAALLAARRADIVRAAYLAVPALRETPHSVVAHVRGGSIGDALRALLRLAQTRAEGWVNIPPPVRRAAFGCAALIGRRGGALSDVAALYAALAAFRNPGLRMAQGIEYVLAGLAEVAANRDCGPAHCEQHYHYNHYNHYHHYHSAGEITARAAIDAVCPTLRACLAHTGDDFNADGVLALIEACVTARHAAVPLTAAVVWAIQRAQSLSMRDMCARIDASTNGVPFPAYYALCYARDSGHTETVERLAALWHCDPRPVLRREAHLAPMCKLWLCAACGRHNSDRFNYCLCSALRHGIVLCARCGYDQDERWAQCQSCGAALRGKVHSSEPAAKGQLCAAEDAAVKEKAKDSAAIAAAVVRRAWTCDLCGAANPSRQTRRCFRCAAATGPVARAAAQLSHIPHPRCHCHGDSENKNMSENKNENESESDAPYCGVCGWVRDAYAAACGGVWRCVCCGARRSTLERTCPSCPHVECTPSAVLPRGTLWACSACRSVAPHPFATRCLQCGGHVEPMDAEGTAAINSTTVNSNGNDNGTTVVDVAVLCARCGSVSLRGAAHCAACGESLSDADSVRIAARHCVACGSSIDALCIAAHCPHCGGFTAPVRGEGWSAAVLCATAAAALRAIAATGPPRVAMFLSAVLRAIAAEAPDLHVAESRVTVAALLSRMDSAEAVSQMATQCGGTEEREGIGRRRGSGGDDDGSARRVAALARQWMEHLDHRAGVSLGPAAKRFAPGECRHCLGSHRAELCAHADDPLWSCGACGAENDNADVCRYVCRECLELRPCVRSTECPSEAWECLRCQRANVDFERYCIFCGMQRAAAESAMETEAEAFPFVPAKCATCGLVYLEARCPICHNDVPNEMRDTEGVVCLVTSQYAFIQPVGTDHPNQRVLVAEPWLRKRRWSEGEKVIFTAQLNERGGGFRVVNVRS